MKKKTLSFMSDPVKLETELRVAWETTASLFYWVKIAAH